MGEISHLQKMGGRCLIFLAVFWVASFLDAWPHEMGHEIAARSMGYGGGWIISNSAIPTGYALVPPLGEIPQPQLFVITAAGGVAVALTVILPFLIVKNRVVKEALKIILVLSLVGGLVEGMTATIGFTDYRIPFLIMGALTLIIFEWGGIFRIRETLGLEFRRL